MPCNMFDKHLVCQQYHKHIFSNNTSVHGSAIGSMGVSLPVVQRASMHASLQVSQQASPGPSLNMHLHQWFHEQHYKGLHTSSSTCHESWGYGDSLDLVIFV